MNLTCKHCCTIFSDSEVCPVCKKEDYVAQIQINIQTNEKG